MRRAVMIFMLILVAALAVLDLTYTDRLEPDAAYPMANRRIQYTYWK